MKLRLFIFIALFATACDINPLEFVRSSSSDVNDRFETSMSWNIQNGYASERSDTENYTIAIVGDSHCGETNCMSDFMTMVDQDSSIFLAINLGDLTEGRRENYNDYLNTIALFPDVKLYNAMGNHDLYHKGGCVFLEVFHTSVYYFTVQTPSATDVHMILDSGNGTLGNKQLKWVEEFLAKNRQKYRHCVLYSHTNIFNTDNSQLLSGYYPQVETFRILSWMSKYKISQMITAHDHYRDKVEWDGVPIITLDALVRTPNYDLLTFTPLGVEHRWETLR